ncbi:hypothetical protein [Algoriphagus halophilus]|uniref:TolB-like 6-blade propeller-like n=1 Tax=Algoriphagus halophilus TaxID=226505 RepID=A0A1N6EIB3_9BACT|nr:hypothetical protein [Algoriphagus halophilus]SIN82762.1 hypothetical protein SAMN05444394_2192 [Algoriphagus halophilus]
MNNSTHPLLFCLLFGFSLFSCTSKTESTVDLNYSLVKVDSFQVNNFTRVSIRDYSHEENIYLGYSEVEDDLLEISENGEIIKRVNKKGDGPGKYGNWNPVGLAFGPNQERIVELPFQVISYDPNYEITHSHRVLSPLPIRTNTPLGKTPYFVSNDTTHLLVGPSNYLTASHLIRNQEGKDTLKNFYQLNLFTGETKMVVPYEPTSVYEQTENVYNGVMGKTFFIDHDANELVVAQELDPEILVYQLPEFTLKNSIPINYSEFLTYNPVPIGAPFDDPQAINLARLSGRNRKLINLGNGFVLLQYFTGITESEFENRNSEENPYSAVQDASEQRILIFKDGKQLPVELPGIEGVLVTALKENKLLVQEPANTEIEEEFTKFTIYQLQTN